MVAAINAPFKANELWRKRRWLTLKTKSTGERGTFYPIVTTSLRIFERLIDSDLHSRKNAYRLCIQYKATHRVKRMAGHCFLWSCESANSGNVDVRMLDRKADCEGIGEPRLDSIEGAIFITDKYVVTYGDTSGSILSHIRTKVAGEIRGDAKRVQFELFERFE